MSDQHIRILVADDHPIVLAGLSATLNLEPDMEVVGCAASGSQTLRLFRETLPDVTIVDITLTPEMSGIDTIVAIRREFPDARIVVLSVHQGEDVIYRALQAGAASYLFKETIGEDLVRTVRDVHSGRGPIPPAVGRKFADRAARTSLTTRELEVLRLIAEGCRNKEIASRLAISDHTVNTHVKNILAKLGANDRTKAVRVALRTGIIDAAT
jgi:DNA-binding NarL/FixJ family response regulator